MVSVCRFKRLTGRHEAQVYESDYKFFAARVKQRRNSQHALSTMTVLQVCCMALLTCKFVPLVARTPRSVSVNFISHVNHTNDNKRY